MTTLFQDESIAARLFPANLSRFITDLYRQHTMQAYAREMDKGIKNNSPEMVIQTKSDKAIRVDHVLAGLGIKPDVALTEAAGIEVADGILVDRQLCTNQSDIYTPLVKWFNSTIPRWINGCASNTKTTP